MSYEVYARLTREIEYLAQLQATESERSNVLSVGCFLEDLLRDILFRFESTPKVAPVELKDGRRPPRNTFAWRILEARERQLLPENVLVDVDTIREIRNIFAHSLGARGLNAAARAQCDRLVLPDNAGEPREASLDDRARHRFNAAARLAIQACISRIFQDEDEYRHIASERREREAARDRGAGAE